MVDTTQQKHTAGLSQHTPGPWTLKLNHKMSGGYSIQSEGKYTFLKLSIGLNGMNEFPSNARLIAAAPELLEACKAVINYIGNRYPYEPCVKKCREAITKAEGR